MTPIIRRELLEVLRTPRALVIQLALAAGCALLVLLRWPTGEVADLSGARALQVLRVFGYGLLTGILLLVPAFPATSFVREKVKGTLALLLNSPMPPWSIYLGKLGGSLGFTFVLLMMTLPAAAACYVLGGTGSQGGVGTLYVVLSIAAVQLTTMALWISLRAQSSDGALRTTYAMVLVVCVLTLVPYMLLRGGSGMLTQLADWVRCLSPIPALMEVLGQGDVGSSGITSKTPVVQRYGLLAGLSSLACALATILQLRPTIFDRSRASGIMTEDRSKKGKAARRLLFLVDPQRRSGHISLWLNPVMVKEFRSRRFGRSSWTLRLIALCAILSLGLSYIAASGALGWGIDAIGGVLVGLQVALLILFAPSLAAGLISSERETGSWQLLRMTPMSPFSILLGKLLSVAWPLILLFCATLPGYIVMTTIKPGLVFQVQRVVLCLGVMAVFAVLLSATASSLFRSTATATTSAYLGLLTICVAPLLVWLAREAPFGQPTVESALTLSPVAAALQASATPGFTGYELLPGNWWLMGALCGGMLIFLCLRTWQLYRPE